MKRSTFHPNGSSVSANRIPPGPKASFPGQRLLRFRRSPTDFLTEMARTYGDMVYMPMGDRQLYLLNHPDFIHQVLVTDQHLFRKGPVLQDASRFLGQGLLTSEGETHRRHRQLLQPSFRHSAIADYVPAMARLAERSALNWQTGKAIQVEQAMSQLTLTIVGQTLLGTDLLGGGDVDGFEAPQAGQMDRQVAALMEVADPLLSWLAPRLPWLPAVRCMTNAEAMVKSVVDQILVEQGGRDRSPESESANVIAILADSELATDTQAIYDHVLTLLLAGHETTAVALTWSWYLLSQSPVAEAHFLTEIDQVLGERLPTFADLDRLVYTQRVVKEALRLYPPAWAMVRQATCDYNLDGYQIPAGAVLLISQWVMHRDPRYFVQPERFDPDRWLQDPQPARHTYFPFGAGSRACIGAGFAQTEAVIVLATLARHWRLGLDPRQRVDVLPRVTLRPKYGMRMIPQRRGGGEL